MELFKKIRALGHYLRQEWQRLCRPFAHHRAKLRAAQKQRPRFLGCACIRDVCTAWGQSFASKSLSRRCDYWNESASYLDLVSQDYVAVQNYEYAISGSATLVQLESRWPRGFRTVCSDCGYIVWGKT